MRKKNQQALRSHGKTWPIWLWIGMGVLLGLCLSALALYREWVPLIRQSDAPQPNPSATAPKPSEPGLAPDTATDKRPAKNESYDFYDALPKMEVVIPETPQQKARPIQEFDGAKRQYLQVGAFRDAAEAETMKAKLALMGMRASTSETSIDQVRWFRVLTGPYTEASTMETDRRALAANGLESIKVAN